VPSTGSRRRLETESAARSTARAGYIYGLAAFIVWGVFPVYFKWLAHVPPSEILAHRILWSVPFLALLSAIGGGWRGLAGFITGRRLLVFLASSATIGANWFFYIWAIGTDHVLEASLGYYITPLMLVVFGVVFLRERPTTRQWMAIALASLGVGILVARFGSVPWIALGLAATMPAYTLVRKLAKADPVSGLLIETVLLAPIALVFLIWLGPASATAVADVSTWGLLAGAGVVTALPLIWFIAAARRLPLTAISLMQFISPSVTFLLAVGVYDEPFTAIHLAAFGFIWVALAIHTVESLRRTG
jgi:chloramphenicol-sensitive protein RarD